MKKPPVHNQRFDGQWKLIQSTGIALKGKSLMDFGCGYGDMLFAASDAGASPVVGIENDPGVLSALRQRATAYPGITIMESDIDLMVMTLDAKPRCDVIFCFAVLPYLIDFKGTLRWFQKSAPVAFLECQYHGDGPGPDFLLGDDDFQSILWEVGYTWAQPLGYTFVSGRNKRRTMWYCKT